MTFREVYAKSMCQPMEQLVDVEQEFPGEVGYIYIPPCVPLQRCSGCCTDENLECHPTLKRYVTMEVIRNTDYKGKCSVYIYALIFMFSIFLPLYLR